MLNPQEIRKEFPILTQKVYGKPLVYLDNAATTQKPQCVIDAIANAYKGVAEISFEGAYCRKDIGAKALKKR